MAIPTENVPERFVPASLTNLANPPAFTLKAGTWRDKNRYRHALQANGLSFHNREAIREEVVRGIHAGWSGATGHEIEAQIREYWAAEEDYASEATPDSPPFDHPFMARAAEVLEIVVSNWPPLARMAADNTLYADESRFIVVSMYVAGWTGIDVPFGLEGGSVALARVAEVEDALRAIEEANAGGRIEGIGAPGTAFAELVLACFERLTLGKSAEKNSGSPPPASDDPNGSPTDGPAKTSGRSKASATSTETPAA